MEKDVCPSASSRLTVDLDAVRANFAAIARRAAPAHCGAVVKADAYGLGALPVAAALRREGCRTFFVAHLSEALALSAVLDPDCTIFILNGLDPDCEPLCADRGFVPVLNAPEQIERWRALAVARGRALPAALQIDSGMSRLGIDLDHATWLAGDPGLAEQLSIRLLMTHLACADIPDHAANAAQLAYFARARALFPSVDASIANSAGVVLGSGFHLDLVRPGIALFGATGDASTLLLSALRLDARIVQIRDVAPATGVGYGLSHVTAEPRRLATLGIGYADGWPRSLSGRGAAWFDGKRLPIIGRVSMDSMTIDISALPEDGIAAGDFVELIGPSQSPADVARDAGTIDHEILARLGSRYQRIYLEGGAAHVQAAGGWQ